MRRVLLAALVLSPVLSPAVLHAQANSPAQPRTAVLESKLVAPSEVAGAAKTGETLSTGRKLRVSTGVVAPKLVRATSIPAENSSFWARTQMSRKFVVGMIVDKTGTPSSLRIIESADAEENRAVLEAVSQYRFTPGTVSNQPTDVPVSLEIVLTPHSGN